MKIKALKKEDLRFLIPLYQQFWDEISDLSKMETLFEALMKKPDYIILGAEIEGKMVGTVMGIVCYELYGECNPFMVMENLVTDKTYRNKGIAKALLSELERIAKQRECGQIQFITEKNRTDAVSFYEAMGYNATSHVGFKKGLQ